MNWQTELNTSAFWLLSSLFWVSLSLVITAKLLSYTHFGKQFWLITKPCITQSNRYKMLFLIIILISFILLEVRISVLNTFFYNGLYSSLQNRDAHAFWFFATINALLVGVNIIRSIINDLMRQVFEIRWLEQLNAVMLDRWLANKNYYRLKYERDLPDNIDQRIEQDAREFITTTVDMIRGVINSVISIIEFTLILWGLSGLLSLFGLEIPKGVVFFIYIFIITATALSVWIGHPLIKLNFNKEKLNGNYRYSLIRVRDNAESIAFYHGEQQEHTFLKQKFNAIIKNRWQIVLKMLGLDGFNTGISEVAKLLPLMLQAPRFFAGQLTLGDMHQTVQSFNRLMRALSFFRLFYEQFTQYQARLNRLAGFFSKLDYLDNQPLSQQINHTPQVKLSEFSIKDQRGNTLLSNINFQLNAGESLLIQGPSGSGKTSLLKAIAGIYAFETSGYLETPKHFLFLPQRPYMPQGTLYQAICYPNIEATIEQVCRAMKVCKLEKYLSHLQQELDWQTILSPGELQRVAFIRILLTKPEAIFLDETTSALDEPTEQWLYQLIKTKLPNTIMISIGHRTTLQQFHQQVLQLL
ncbi:ABC transporter ATP-binding protein [Gallibacterium salpingitidis]|uniref:ABC transporter ATP-binding protein n=1 Tax=Gallibacterium salpingitidis TaxID=505341 RepID=A0AB36E3A4_9PAST|nr:ABC transporter ATP-binding protein/permease [Gallibacterium salpingitidis]OBX09107.1 ABC transporter ATP-binding protein [Gallibacterium salpingitidis]OBX10920.1 ABC transporter ATP-binding protein [Gallibacterium salpingitidis]WKS99704.1 ABC transporter ATP-binding protein/permease [Gallibacterium salpingitidis]